MPYRLTAVVKYRTAFSVADNDPHSNSMNTLYIQTYQDYRHLPGDCQAG